jgi:hypothetical protein
MDKQVVDLRDKKDYMYGYLIVSKIYEIRDISANDNIDYNELYMGKDVFNWTNEINFIVSRYVDIVDDIDVITKIGRLYNFSVFLDPSYERKISMYSNGDKRIDIDIIL